MNLVHSQHFSSVFEGYLGLGLGNMHGPKMVILVNPILRGIKSNLFYAGGGRHICPPMISREKKFFAQFLLHTKTTTQNRVTHKKTDPYLKKQNNGGRFKIAQCNMTGRFSSIFAFFTSSH